MRWTLFLWTLVGLFVLFSLNAKKFLDSHPIAEWQVLWLGFFIVFVFLAGLFVYVIINRPTGE